MEILQEIEDYDGLFRIEKIKLFREIVPLENSFIVKSNSSIEVVKDERVNRKMQKLHRMSKSRR
jgi:hypothetical protein